MENTKWVMADYLPAIERVECAEDGDLGIVGSRRVRSTRDDEGAGIWDGATLVESVEDELLKSLRHGVEWMSRR